MDSFGSCGTSAASRSVVRRARPQDLCGVAEAAVQGAIPLVCGLEHWAAVTLEQRLIWSRCCCGSSALPAALSRQPLRSKEAGNEIVAGNAIPCVTHNARDSIGHDAVALLRVIGVSGSVGIMPAMGTAENICSY